MASLRRLEKLNMLLKEELARIIDREVDFPAGTLVTITRVETSSDMHYTAALCRFWETMKKTQWKF